MTGLSIIHLDREVKVIENIRQIFVTSILNQVISIKSEEEELHDSQLIWRLGITLERCIWLLQEVITGLVLGMKTFYVSMPQGEAKPMPNRDVIELPQLNALGLVMHLPYEVLSYLKLGKGEVKDFTEIIPENLFLILCDMDLLFFDGGSWFLTEEGTATIDLVSGTSVVAELKTEKYSDLENKLNKIKEENPDSFIGWA